APLGLAFALAGSTLLPTASAQTTALAGTPPSNSSPTQPAAAPSASTFRPPTAAHVSRGSSKLAGPKTARPKLDTSTSVAQSSSTTGANLTTTTTSTASAGNGPGCT